MDACIHLRVEEGQIFFWGMKTKKGNNKWKEKNQIGEKRGFCQPVEKKEKQANISTRTSAKYSKYFDKNLRQVALSAQKNKKEEKETKKKQQQNLTFLSELYERKKDTKSNNKNQLEINEWEVTN